MADFVIIRGEDGQYTGVGEKDRRAWEKFMRVMQELEPGGTLKMSYQLPRSGPHHRYLFAKLAGLLERQEVFEDRHQLLEWLKVGAGHVTFMPGANGGLVAMPESIAWHRLEEQDFIEFHRELNNFLWTPHAQAFLWPHLDEWQRYRCIEHWHRDFERTRPPCPSPDPNPSSAAASVRAGARSPGASGTTTRQPRTSRAGHPQGQPA